MSGPILSYVYICELFQLFKILYLSCGWPHCAAVVNIMRSSHFTFRKELAGVAVFSSPSLLLLFFPLLSVILPHALSVLSLFFLHPVLFTSCLTCHHLLGSHMMAALPLSLTQLQQGGASGHCRAKIGPMGKGQVGCMTVVSPHHTYTGFPLLEVLLSHRLRDS